MNWKICAAFIKRRPIISFVAALWLVLLVGNLLKIAVPSLRPATHPPSTVETQAEAAHYPDTEATQSIHLETYPGTVGQAAQLLELMSNQPGHGRYTLTFFLPEEVIVFGCDLNRQRLVRIHQRPHGAGAQEVWTGYVEERLQAGAKGDTLNTTPAGTVFGTHDTL